MMNRKKTISELKKIFQEKDISKSKEIKESEQKGYNDPANVLMIIPKTNIGLEILTSNFEIGEPQKVPELIYNNKEGLNSTCNYSVEYMKVILDFLKCFEGETVKLSVSKDYPLTVELEHFKIILAPRVDND